MVKAQIRHLPMNYRKVKPVVELVRGRSVADALVILDHTPRRAAAAVAKLLVAARANASHNGGYRPDSLMINEIFVTAGMRLRRYRLAHRRTHGYRRPVPYQRHSCHLQVRLDGQLRRKPAAKPPAPAAAAKTGEAASGTKS